MSKQSESQAGRTDIRTSMGRRGPGNPGRIEKAKAPKQALARSLPYLQPYKIALAAVFLLVLLYTAAGLLGPYLMGVAIDDFIIAKDLNGLARIALIMLVTFLLSGGLQIAANWTMARISQGALKRCELTCSNICRTCRCVSLTATRPAS